MAETLTVTMKRSVALEQLRRAVAQAWHDLLGSEVEVEASSAAGASELGAGEDEVRLRLGGTEIVLTVFGLPDHHCIPEDLAAFWTVVGPAGGESAASLAGTAAVALALAREVGAAIVDSGGRWTRTRELDAAEFEEAVRLRAPVRGGDGALEQFASRLRPS